MSGRGVGGMGAGCAGLSLIGLLIGVGLTVWLGAKVLDATSPTPASTSGPVEESGAISVDPRTGLADGATVTVGISGLEPGPLEISLCLTPANRFELARCDEDRSVPATIDADGDTGAQVVVARVITVEGSEVDCSRAPGTCALVAHAPGSTVGPAAPLSFEPS